jgi:hypothetical protein
MNLKRVFKKENIFPSPLSPFSLQAQPARLSLPLSFLSACEANLGRRPSLPRLHALVAQSAFPRRPNAPLPPFLFRPAADRWGSEVRVIPNLRPLVSPPPPPIKAAARYRSSPARPLLQPAQPRFKAAVKLLVHPPSSIGRYPPPLLNLSPLNSNQGRGH